jgi:hypothetical protein
MIPLVVSLLLGLLGCGNGSHSSDGHSGSPLTCDSSVDVYCAGIHEVQCSWSAEIGSPACQSVATCGGYLVANQHGVDTGTYSYYDQTTGQLLAVTAYGVPGRLTCAAGSSGGFVVPDCPVTEFVACTDTQRPCVAAVDCGVNPAASCAKTCADGSNPCVLACVANRCEQRGCPTP